MTKVVPEVVPEVGKPFIYAVELTSRKLWSRPGTPTLVTHFGPPLGGPGGARISRHVPKIAQIHFCWLPPSDSPLAWKKRRGLLPQKRHPPPGDMGQSRFSQCKSWIAGVVQVNTLFTVLRNASSKVRDTFFSSNPKAPILSKSPDQLRKYELWLVRPKRKFWSQNFGRSFLRPLSVLTCKQQLQLLRLVRQPFKLLNLTSSSPACLFVLLLLVHLSSGLIDCIAGLRPVQDPLAAKISFFCRRRKNREKRAITKLLWATVGGIACRSRQKPTQQPLVPLLMWFVRSP